MLVSGLRYYFVAKSELHGICAPFGFRRLTIPKFDVLLKYLTKLTSQRFAHPLPIRRGRLWLKLELNWPSPMREVKRQKLGNSVVSIHYAHEDLVSVHTQCIAQFNRYIAVYKT